MNLLQIVHEGRPSFSSAHLVNLLREGLLDQTERIYRGRASFHQQYSFDPALFEGNSFPPPESSSNSEVGENNIITLLAEKRERGFSRLRLFGDIAGIGQKSSGGRSEGMFIVYDQNGWLHQALSLGKPNISL